MNSPTGLLFRKLAILATPLIALFATYVLLDPFHVIRRDPEAWVFHGVFPNREVMSTEFLLRQKGRPFDAFVIGNSRSQAFLCRDWTFWIGPATPFHYDALRDTLLGLRGKLRLLERERYPLRHVLVILGKDLLEATTDTSDPVSIKHPAVSQGSRLVFQAAFLKAFFSDLFLVKYLDYRLFRTIRPYMSGAIAPGELAMTFDRQTFDVFHTQAEREIAARPDRYYASRIRSVDRTPRDALPVIGEPQRKMLTEIRDTFVRHGTDFQIVIGPDFERVRLSSADVALLRTLFGDTRVHDFSRDPGLGLEIHDWYDMAHYRPSLAREMLARVYGRASGEAPLSR